MKWRVMTRTDRDTVMVWTGGLTEEMADCTATLLRAWRPPGISSAWAEPEWDSAITHTMTRLARPTSAGTDAIAA